MKAARTLREKIDAEILVTGILATSHLWPELIEICMEAGLDYLIVDTEHGAFSPELITDVCALGRLLDFAVFVRPIATDLTTVRRALDWGPCGLLLPCVDSAAILDDVRDAVYLPPRGRRRPGGAGNRWVRDYSQETWKTVVEDALIVLPQIETRQGLARVDEIAAHELTTAMAAGPYDLSADLGVCGRTSDPLVVDAIARIRAAGRAAGKNMWMIGHGPTLRSQGINFICIGEPTWILQASLRRLVEETRAGA